MNISSRKSRLSRAKAAIGALAATAALAGAAQAALPASAAALKARNPCDGLVNIGHEFEAAGNQTMADWFYDRYWDCIAANQ